MYKDVIFVKTWSEVNTLAEVLIKNGYEVLIHYDRAFEDESKNSYSIRFTHPRWDEDSFMTYDEYEEQKKVEKLIDEAEDDGELKELKSLDDLFKDYTKSISVDDINRKVDKMLWEAKQERDKKKKDK